MLLTSEAPLTTLLIRALLAAFGNEAVGDKLKERTENRTYHAIPEDKGARDANRVMAFLEMVTGQEAETLLKGDDLSLEELREWINPGRRCGDDLPTDGQVQLDYNPTILLDKEDKLRVIRPLHRWELELPPVPCPILSEGYEWSKLKDYQETHEAVSPKNLAEMPPFPCLSQSLNKTEQSFRLLDPATGEHGSWELMYGKCMTIPRHICVDRQTGCDEIIVDKDLLENMK